MKIVKIKKDKLSLEVDVANGGRAISFALNGKNLLATNVTQVGSVFWTAPQSDWDWPPPSAIDNEPYQLIEATDKIHLHSQSCSILGVSIEKQYQFVDSGALRIDYSINNNGDANRRYAPWEVTRVPGGVSFLKSNKTLESLSNLSMQKVNDAIWFEYQPSAIATDQKWFGFSEAGWLANANNGLLFIKTFPQISVDSVAPGEAEVEIFANADEQSPYIELEQQGEYKIIKPGESIDWNVYWYVLPVPASVDVSIGNPILLEMVEAQLNS